MVDDCPAQYFVRFVEDNIVLNVLTDLVSGESKREGRTHSASTGLLLVAFFCEDGDIVCGSAFLLLVQELEKGGVVRVGE